MSALKAETCASCMHWARKGSTIAGAVHDGNMPLHLGACRFAPPQLFQLHRTDQIVPMVPATHENWVCGCWEGHAPDPDDPAREDIPDDNVTELRRAA